MIDGFKAAAGSDWVPTAVFVDAELPQSIESLLSNETVVKSGAGAVGIAFPTEMLALSMTGFENVENGTGRAPKLEPSAAVRIEAVLDASKDTLLPTLVSVSNLFNMSPRSLQRRLDAEGMTFFQVVDGWRCNRALKAVTDPALKIGEIAENLRYSDTAHFTRAFKRRTGIPPQSFRERQAALA